MPTRVYLIDIDGTIADPTHRLHHIDADYSPPDGTPIAEAMWKPDWEAFHAAAHQDPVIEHMRGLVRSLQIAGQTMVYATGRMEKGRTLTTQWLRATGFLTYDREHPRLYMRPNDDFRPDTVVKLEMLAAIRADGYEPIMAFEDRSSVVRMWREAGIPCAQVQEGDY